jgi:BirA family biotin operon repressor/biotin-[acetyl-CoA-carboxylase] ligase
LNVTNQLPGELQSSAISLADLTPAPSPEWLAVPVAEALAEAGSRSGPLDEEELDRWNRRDRLRGQPVTVGAVSGIASGIGPDGALLVRLGSGVVVPVGAGEAVPADRGAEA